MNFTAKIHQGWCQKPFRRRFWQRFNGFWFLHIVVKTPPPSKLHVLVKGMGCDCTTGCYAEETSSKMSACRLNQSELLNPLLDGAEVASERALKWVMGRSGKSGAATVRGGDLRRCGGRNMGRTEVRYEEGEELWPSRKRRVSRQGG